MKALSIKQPWASLIAHGINDIENLEFLKNEFKKEYNALSIDVGTLEDFLRLKK